MLKVLLKKQLTEIFRSYFYDQKKNKARSKGGIIAMFALYILLMAGFLGGTFTMLSLSMCPGMVAADIKWLYFLVFGTVSLLLGVFGSVFSTYSSLYLAKDNDLLLAMPIRVKDLIVSRLAGVYLIGAMYSLVVIIPAIIVYWIFAAPSGLSVFGCILFVLLITALVLVLSAALGWVVAKISLKLKNKSYVTVLISLLFFAGYYFVYFKAADFIQTLIANASFYGEKIKGAAYALYLFGSIGEGNLPAICIFTSATVLLVILMWWVISRSFLNIATATGNEKKALYKEKRAVLSSPSSAFLRKEFGRFTSSANYMLNCGLGVLFIPAGGVALLIKGKELSNLINGQFGAESGMLTVILCAAICLMASMNDSAAPSVSLEGKTIWIPQSLPIRAWMVLRSKLLVQVLITLVPMLLCLIMIFFAGLLQPIDFVLVSAVCLCDGILNALFCLFLGVKMPNLNWTNEVTPVKQSASVMFSLFFGWGVPLIIFGAYMLVGQFVGAVIYLSVLLAVMILFSFLLLRWLKKKGSAQFSLL